MSAGCGSGRLFPRSGLEAGEQERRESAVQGRSISELVNQSVIELHGAV